MDNGGVEAQNGAVEGLYTIGRRFASLRRCASKLKVGSASKWKEGFGSATPAWGSVNNSPLALERKRCVQSGEPKRIEEKYRTGRLCASNVKGIRFMWTRE